MRDIFRSLRVRNYRLFAAGQVVSLTGTWMQRVAQDWLVLELSRSSGIALGVTTGLQFLPTLLFGLYGGVLADRYDKRRMLVATQVAMGLFALALGLLVVTHAVNLVEVYALAFALGLASAVDTPVRQAFVVELVGPAEVVNAVGLNSATFNSARVVGPAAAGVLISGVGTGPVFLINAASFLAVLAGLLLMRPGELHRAAPVPRSRGQLREGLRYVRGRPDLLLPIVLVGVVGTFGLNFQITLALVARLVFHRGATSYGLLSTSLAVGSLLGALVSASRRGARPRLRLLLGSAFVFGLLEVGVGFMPTYLGVALLLLPTGAAVLTFTIAANSTVQLGASPQMRGRVMALYVLVFLGGAPLGSPVIGWLAEVAGPRSSLWIGGGASALAAAAVAVRLGLARRPVLGAGLLPRAAR
ncbi:MAG: MFS transporter [Mycobacteriales bacterium]